MSRRKQIKPRHFETEFDSHAFSLAPRHCSYDVSKATDILGVTNENEVNIESAMDQDNINDQQRAALDYHRYLTQRKLTVMESKDKDMPMSRESSSFERFQPLVSNKGPIDEQIGMTDSTISNKDKDKSADLSGESGVAEDQSDFGSDFNDSDVMMTSNMAAVSDVIDKLDAENKLDYEQDQPSGNNSDPDIKLKTLENTDVAVAQIVENNFPTAENVPSLMQTVYTLWQQQVMQCQMLEILRQNLMKVARDRKIEIPTIPVDGLQNYNDFDYANDMLQSAIDKDERAMSPDSYGSDFVDDGTPLEMENSDDVTHLTSAGGVASSVISPSTASEAPKMDSFYKGVGAGKLRDVGTALERSQYAAEDPLFRHKCRFCYKVFGSDSALQIHVRSHTGEKPYVCDRCGSKFSTRGNLKVHYERHIYESQNPLPSTSQADHTDIGGGQSTDDSAPMSRPLPTSNPAEAETKTIGSGTDTTKATDEERHIDDFEKAREDGLSDSVFDTHANPDRASVPSTSASESLTHREEADEGHRFSLNMITSSSPVAGHVPAVPLPSNRMMFPSSFGSPPFGMPPLPFGMPPSPFFRPSILPRQDDDDSLEEFMEIDKSETSKLEAMVKNIETKLTDPNQCAICKRILSCKSALQMHYRIHTGERPFKCKICGRAFTTKGNLKTHMSVHRIKPPIKAMHQCMICHRQFTNTLVLQQHMQSHATEMPRMFPPPPHGFMSPPGSMPFPMPFPGFPFPMSPAFSRMPHMSPGLPHEMRKPFWMNDRHDRDREEDAFANEDDRRSQPTPGFRPDSVDSANVKRPRIDEDVEGQHLEDNMEEKRQRLEGGEGESAESTDDEEVPREFSHQERNFGAISQNTTPIIHLPPRNESRHSIDTSTPFHSQSHAVSTSTYAPRSGSSVARCSSSSDVAVSPRLPPHPDDGDRPAYQDTPAADSLDESREERDMKRPFGLSPHQPSPFMNKFPFMDYPRMHPLDFAQMGSRTNTTCDICLKTFACKSALDIHYRSHTKEKPFKCELCDRGFSTKGNMKQHMLSHSARELQSINYNFSSDDSHDTQSSFSSQSQPQSQPLPPPPPPQQREYPPINPFSKAALMSPNEANKQSPGKPEDGFHFARTPEPVVIQPETHKPVNPVTPLMRDTDDFLKKPNLKHMCRVCVKPFSSSSALMIHMRTHTGERPFRCEVCNKGFTTKGNLKVHMSTHEDRNSFLRRGRRMSVDGVPRFDSHFPPPFPMAFHPGALPPKSSPADFYMPPRPPIMGFPPLNGFISRPNEIPVIQISPRMKMSDSMSERTEISPRTEGSPHKENLSAKESSADMYREVNTSS